jgi:signal peptidase I
MIRFIKVTGSSLSPFFLPGDYVLVSRSRLLAGELEQGDIIVFDHPEHGRLIKMIASFPDPDHLVVTGYRPESIDSTSFGPISRSSVIGKVIWHISR